MSGRTTFRSIGSDQGDDDRGGNGCKWKVSDFVREEEASVEVFLYRNGNERGCVERAENDGCVVG